jgi:hypothetical protein
MVRAYKFLLRPTVRQDQALSEMLADHCSRLRPGTSGPLVLLQPAGDAHQAVGRCQDDPRPQHRPDLFLERDRWISRSRAVSSSSTATALPVPSAPARALQSDDHGLPGE